MKKFFKRLTVLAVLGTIAGLLASYFRKTHADTDSTSGHAMDDEEFDLDTDLQPVSGREYVPLKKAEETPADDKSK